MKESFDLVEEQEWTIVKWIKANNMSDSHVKWSSLMTYDLIFRYVSSSYRCHGMKNHIKHDMSFYIEFES